MSHIMEQITTIVMAIIGLAIISVLVSKTANTTSVIQASASALANNIGVAESPVTGTSLSLSLGYPSGSSFSNSFGG